MSKSKHNIDMFLRGSRNVTSFMTTRQIATYLEKQKAQGWPGSVGIHPGKLAKKKAKAKAKKEPTHVFDIVEEQLAARTGNVGEAA